MNTKFKFIKKSNKQSIICIYKLTNGLSESIGNTFRRILLSSIKGFALVSIMIKNLRHQYDYIDGVCEDAMEISLNLKNVVIKLINCKRIKISVCKTGPCFLKASDLSIKGFTIIINPNYKICKINKGFKLVMNMDFRTGIGYVNYLENKFYFNKKNIKNKIFIDNCFSPVLKANYKTLKKNDSEKLILYIETNGSVNSFDVFFESCNVFYNQFKFFKKKIKYEKNNNFLYDKIDILDFKKKTLKYLKKKYSYIYELFCKKKNSFFIKKEIKKIFLNEIIIKLKKIGIYNET
ncbi:hypothetical protein [Candidatus Vidania fulgoroideorum]